MAEVDRGFVTHQFRDQREAQALFSLWAEGARDLLKAQGNHSPDVLARGWDELDETEQVALGDELLEIPRLSVSASAPDIYVNDLHPGVIQPILTAAETYNDTLPFTRAERLWLTDSRFRALEGIGFGEITVSAVHWVVDQREEVVMLGQRQTVSGAELIGREWDWIRGAGGYESNSTYHDATRQALQGIAYLFDASVS